MAATTTIRDGWTITTHRMDGRIDIAAERDDETILAELRDGEDSLRLQTALDPDDYAAVLAAMLGCARMARGESAIVDCDISGCSSAGIDLS